MARGGGDDDEPDAVLEDVVAATAAAVDVKLLGNDLKNERNPLAKLELG